VKFAVLSDIHGNLTALEAVLNDIANESVDQIICLGDLAYKGPEPTECVSKVRSLGIPSKVRKILNIYQNYLLNTVLK
jgi:Icc-related predicted phosphoesterase